MRLEGKVCIITGGGSGIGRASALLFAQEGARLAVADKRAASAEAVAAESSRKGAEAIALEVDVANAAAVERMIARTLEKFGRLDVLVNNAGYGITGSVVETDEAAWDALMAVNVRGVFLCSKYAIPAMKRNGGGTIVNTASVVAAVGIANRAAYCASKGAVRRARSTRRISTRSSKTAPIRMRCARRSRRGNCSDAWAPRKRSRPASCFSPATRAGSPPAPS